MPKKRIKINRAPVLTLWAAVLAERFGYDEREAFTLAKAASSRPAHQQVTQIVE